MRKVMVLLAAILLLAAPAYAQTVYYDDFSGGLDGWTQVNGGVDLGAQVFSSANPMNVIECYEDNGDKKLRDSEIDATALPTTDGNAVGWAATGMYTNQAVQRISRVFNLQPGKYNMTAYFSATAWNQTRVNTDDNWPEEYAAGAVFLALAGSDIGRTDFDPALFDADLWDPSSTRNTTWNNSWEGNTEGNWIAREKVKEGMDLQDGRVEISLGMFDKFDNDPGQYRWAGFDDLYIEFTPTELYVPEPGSIVALLTGIVGLGGLAIRRRK